MSEGDVKHDKEKEMLTISYQTIVILILLAFIFGLLVGLGRSRII